MKIYTRGGDKGKTSLLGGSRISKADRRIDAYGNVDELNSWVGLLRDQQVNANRHLLLVEIQDRLFTIGSHLANEKADSDRFQIPEIHEEDVTRLEEAIDQMNEKLPEMKSFILPGGTPLNSFLHLARTVCRRAERETISLSQTDSVNGESLKFLNRLSDLLFVAARSAATKSGKEEVLWHQV